jgi:hypothetical protein
MIGDFINESIFGSLLSSDTQTIGIGGYTAEVRIRDQMTLTSTAPTSYLEDGSFVQDHIINDPISFSLSGEIADIIVQSGTNSSPFISPPGIVGEITGFSLPYTASQQQVIDTAITSVSNAIDDFEASSPSDIFGLFQGLASDGSVSGSFVQFIKSIHASKTLISIQTAFGTMENMRITSCTFDQTDNNWTNYSMSLQEIRFAKIETVAVEETPAKSPTGDASTQTQTAAEKGTVSGTTPSTTQEQSFLSTVLG